jgi:ABC-2 type transport system permease protein
MNRLILVRKTLRDVRGATIAIGAVLFIMALLDVLIYPSYRDSLADFELPEAFRGFLGEAGTITSPEGFLTAEFFSWIPLLLITIAVIGGTGALAGEEGAGTMDLLLAQPISRTRLVLEKTAGLVAAIALAALASFPGFLLGAAFTDIGVGMGRIFAAVVNMLPITLLFLALSLWGSATLPGRGAAAALAVGVVVVTYFLYTVGSAVDAIEGVRKLSPFYWADASRVLVRGFDWARAGALTAIAAALFVLALIAFVRRDVSAGAREWGLRLPAWMGLPHRRAGGQPFDAAGG